MFQNDFYGTDEFEEQMSNFLANFHFPEEHEISEKDEKEVREKVERLIALMPDIDEKISANAKGFFRDEELSFAIEVIERVSNVHFTREGETIYIEDKHE